VKLNVGRKNRVGLLLEVRETGTLVHKLF
jgi:hypothetical protein